MFPNKMKILIDGDGCPVIPESENAASLFHLESIIVCDTSHLIRSGKSRIVVVDKGADSADFTLTNLIKPGDVVITQDYGLAAMCLSRGARVMDQNGMRYTQENIDALLSSRAEAARIRRGGGRLKGPAKRTAQQNEAFISAFHELIQEAYDAAKEVKSQ